MEGGFESKGLRVILLKTKVMVSGGITQDCLSKSKLYPCGVCFMRVKANSILCVQCVRCTHGRCDGVKRLLKSFRGILHAKHVREILERRWSKKGSYVMKWKQFRNSHIVVTG